MLCLTFTEDCEVYSVAAEACPSEPVGRHLVFVPTGTAALDTFPWEQAFVARGDCLWGWIVGHAGDYFVHLRGDGTLSKVRRAAVEVTVWGAHPILDGLVSPR